MTGRRRGPLVAALTLLVLVVGAPAASAHGLGGVGASNYASTVTDVVAADADPAVAVESQPPVEVEGVRWSVLGGQDFLAVHNDSGRDLVVLGYEREPYLRVGPEGVFENRRSRTTWLNRDRYASLAGVTLPDDLDDEAPPDWVRVADGTSHAWHDHRAQWMNAAEDAAAVVADPTVEHLVTTWEVAFVHDGDELAVVGELRWLPPPAAGVGLGPGAALVLVPVLVTWVLRYGRRWPVMRAAAGTLAVVAIAVVAYEVDGVLASRLVATTQEVVLVVVQLVAMLVVAGLATWLAWRRPERARLPLLVTATALTALFGIPETGLLTSAVAPGSIPSLVGRILVGASLVALVPAILAVSLSGRPEPAVASEPAPA